MSLPEGAFEEFRSWFTRLVSVRESHNIAEFIRQRWEAEDE